MGLLKEAKDRIYLKKVAAACRAARGRKRNRRAKKCAGIPKTASWLSEWWRNTPWGHGICYNLTHDAKVQGNARRYNQNPDIFKSEFSLNKDISPDWYTEIKPFLDPELQKLYPENYGVKPQNVATPK